MTRVDHEAHDESYRSDVPNLDSFQYTNRFKAIPEALRFRPQRITPKPVISSMQTATVVGPAGEEIFVDKYGRIKVQFHWDREGKMDANSSCWIRVGQVWAGKLAGVDFSGPASGHEVVVNFEEGDPDQPLITGSVYNAVNMPPFILPLRKKLGGIKSATVTGNSKENFNGIVFFDEKGNEHTSIHSERNMTLNAEFDTRIKVGRHRGDRVPGASLMTVGRVPGGS